MEDKRKTAKLHCYESMKGTVYQIAYVWVKGGDRIDIVGKRDDGYLTVTNSLSEKITKYNAQIALDRLADTNGWIWHSINKDMPVVNCLHGGKPKWEY